MRPYRFAVLACSAAKLRQAAKAKDLYVGALFVLAYQYAELVADRVLILSARHGVVEADCVLEPYDQQLPTEKHRRAQWGVMAARGLCAAIAPGVDWSSVTAMDAANERVLCLAPQSYVEPICMYGKRGWTRPLKGLAIGQQKRRLDGVIIGTGPARALVAVDGKVVLTGDGLDPPSQAARYVHFLIRAPEMARLLARVVEGRDPDAFDAARTLLAQLPFEVLP